MKMIKVEIVKKVVGGVWVGYCHDLDFTVHGETEYDMECAAYLKMRNNIERYFELSFMDKP